MTEAAGEKIVLQPALDMAEAAELRALLVERQGLPVTLEAGEVAHLGAHCLQILLAAAAAWRAAGTELRIENPSETLLQWLGWLGCGLEDITAEGSAR